jgi:hypothetical protein
MAKDRRTATRRGVTWTALIIDSAGRPVCECTIVNVSSNGARLVLHGPVELPSSFLLVLSKNGGVRRRCQVIRRESEAVGVKFVMPQPSESASAARFNSTLARIAAKRGDAREETADSAAAGPA